MTASPFVRSLTPLGMMVLALFLQACSPQSARIVNVYTSQDQVYAEPILAAFTKLSGIETRTLYDSEAVKTVGLANRLIAERNNPQCDVFWNNEELRTRQLAAMGVFRSVNGWDSFGFRSRRLVINTNLLAVSEAPKTLQSLTNAAWRGRIALAYPLFGTTATHFLALRNAWGESRWEAWCRALKENAPFLLDGNSMVVRLVGKGEAWIGMTDSDDIAAGQREGFPIIGLPLSNDSLLIPNTVAIVRNAPHPDAAESLLNYLRTPEVVRALENANALENTILDGNAAGLTPDWEHMLEELDKATEHLKSVFLR